MARLLLISFHYPPRATIGSIRPGALAKHLPKFGWEVLAVTPRLPRGSRASGGVIETPYRDALEKWKRRVGLDPHRGVHDQLNLSVATQPRSQRLHTKFLHRVKSILTYPDFTMGWAPFAIDAIKNIDVPIDAVLSTGPPITSHVIAQRSSKHLEVPLDRRFSGSLGDESGQS